MVDMSLKLLLIDKLLLPFFFKNLLTLFHSLLLSFHEIYSLKKEGHCAVVFYSFCCLHFYVVILNAPLSTLFPLNWFLDVDRSPLDSGSAYSMKIHKMSVLSPFLWCQQSLMIIVQIHYNIRDCRMVIS